MNRIAECCCGQLSIEVAAEPEIHGVCHCNNCKKRTGSAFGISSYFNIEQVTNQNGEASCYSLHNAEQSHDQERYFCKKCGTTLFWKVSTMPDLIGIAGGCFIKDPLGEPTFSASHTNSCSWLTLPHDWIKNA